MRPISPLYSDLSNNQVKQSKPENGGKMRIGFMQDQNTRKRWINTMVEAAKHETTAMPWARGARRAKFIAKRHDALAQAA